MSGPARSGPALSGPASSGPASSGPAGEYAGPVSRTVAFVLDVFVVAVVFTAGAIVAGLVASVVGIQHGDLVRAAVSAYLLLLPATLALYCALFWMLAGRTPGMALLGVRVVATG